MTGARDDEFTVDFSMLDDPEESAPTQAQVPGEDEETSALRAEAERLVRQLAELLRPYGDDPIEKAFGLVVGHGIELTHETADRKTYAVHGSRPYVTRVTTGGTELYAECSCPNGTARGGDSTCYHSIAARVVAAGLADAWAQLGRIYP